MWFKVVIRRDGAVASCEKVAERFEDGASVYFVDADSKADAITQAKKRRQEVKRATRTKLLSLGLCEDCRRPAKPGKNYCADCLTNRAKREREYRAGTFIPKTHEQLSEVHRLRPRMSHERVVCLREVLAKLDELGERGLRSWIAEQLRQGAAKAEAI